MTDDWTTAAQRRLHEAFDELSATLVDHAGPWGDDGERWLPLGGAKCGTVLGEAELAAARAECRQLALSNEFAINGHENRISFLIGSGHSYRVVGRRHASGGGLADLLFAAQHWLEEFQAENRWHRRQQEIVRRLDRDGEAFLRYFPGDDGMLRLRFVEPDQVASPAGWSRPEASHGILADPADVETVEAYCIDGEWVAADQIQHRRANVDANVKRGLPLFYPVRKNLRRAEKLLRNMSTVAEIQSSIALIRRHRTATRTSVQQFVAAHSDPARDAAGRPGNVRRLEPGTILDAHGGIDYDFPAAALDAAKYVAVLQAELRAIASRLVMPEFMLSSDASNANYSSTLVAEGPAMRMFARLQADLITDDLAVLRRGLQHAAACGRLPAEAPAACAITAIAPSLSVRHPLEEAQVASLLFRDGVLSLQTWSQQLGLDFAQEQAQRRAAENRLETNK